MDRRRPGCRRCRRGAPRGARAAHGGPLRRRRPPRLASPPSHHAAGRRGEHAAHVGGDRALLGQGRAGPRPPPPVRQRAGPRVAGVLRAGRRPRRGPRRAARARPRRVPHPGPPHPHTAAGRVRIERRSGPRAHPELGGGALRGAGDDRATRRAPRAGRAGTVGAGPALRVRDALPGRVARPAPGREPRHRARPPARQPARPGRPEPAAHRRAHRPEPRAHRDARAAGGPSRAAGLGHRAAGDQRRRAGRRARALPPRAGPQLDRALSWRGVWGAEASRRSPPPARWRLRRPPSRG